MEQVVVTIRLSDDYKDRLSLAKNAADLRKCRCWFDMAAVTDDCVAAEFNGSGIVLRYNTRKGPVEERCTYDSVLNITQMKEGVLLRLSHRRLLFLPVTDRPQDNESLMHALKLLSEQCRYIFRSGHMPLPGVSWDKRLRFYTRSNRGAYTGTAWIKAVQILVICICLFMGTVFVNMLFQNRAISQQEAVKLTATFKDYEIHYGGRNWTITDIELQFYDAQEQTVDGSSITDGLEQLAKIPQGTEMQLLIHPDSENVLQIKVAGETLLEFDSALKGIRNEAVAFFILGLAVYAIGGFLIVAMIRKKT